MAQYSLTVNFLDNLVFHDYVGFQAECYRSVELDLVIGSTSFSIAKSQLVGPS